MANHPKDSAEPPNNKRPTKRTKTSSKRAAKKTNDKKKLVDEDPYMAMSRKTNRMTPLERKFGDAYVNNIGIISARNDEDYAIAVAIEAGIEDYNAKSWSKNALNEPCVQHYINGKSRDQLKSQEITKEKILAEYAKIAFSSVGDILDLSEGGRSVKLKSFDEMGEDTLATIKSIKETSSEKSTTLTVDQHDKMRALDFLAKHEGLIDENGNNQLSAEEMAVLALNTAKAMSLITGGK